MILPSVLLSLLRRDAPSLSSLVLLRPDYGIVTAMRTAFRMHTSRFMLLAFLLFVLSCPGCNDRQGTPAARFEDNPLYKNYRFSNDETVIELGVPTPWSAVNQIVEVMKRDEVLRKDLARQGCSLRFYPFLKGEEINYFIDKGALEGAIMGDMPTLIAAAKGRVTVLSLFHKGSVSLVSRAVYRVRDLKGKKVAYPRGSTSHYYLLRLLDEKGLSEIDIRHVPMDTNKMFEAIEHNRIDALATFEPTATVFTKMDPMLHTISRSFSSYGFFSLRKEYARKHPRAALAIIEARLRAVAWLRESERNMHEAGRWAAEEARKVTDLPLAGYLAELDALCSEDLSADTQIPANRVNSAETDDQGRLHKEFEFLKRKGFVRQDEDWKDIAAEMDTRVLRRAPPEMPRAAASGSGHEDL